ncbi:roadblock/LC7 domain-containing protein [Streptomyces sp. PU10]|uniref:roadblock/LC7 domain-containing protein n=1 Tax=Streptomyces TaxID=1883 RepID=UPI0015924BE0|nr:MULTISPECIES: roadblock/LC7 domain-containing protein [unclassified Streptomyces]MDU0258045.1 roadblock/LC7 domain-containing protein [Streptomyces sp. PU10]QKW59335.1 roadblock/LC7 domain-containing protein [Streptomyces sp. NA03103]WST99508.1 roadblock/LC7 domain-containing protein [Streptomyces sp. NBC_01124]
MAVESDVLDELHRLRNRVPQLTGSLAATVDGLVLAHDAPGTEPEGLAALTAAALGVAHRTAEATARGGFRELLLRGADGYVATYAAGPSAVLTLLADGRVNVGRLHLEGRRSGARIGELVAAGLGPERGGAPDAEPVTALPDRAARPIGTLPVRTPQRPAHQPAPRAGGHHRPT